MENIKMSIQKPKMILFDYGHTLLYEIGHNAEKGNKAIYQYISTYVYKYVLMYFSYEK